MSHCSLLSKDAASIVGYEHDIGSGFASWQWEAPLPSDRDGRQGPSTSLHPRLFSWVVQRPYSMCHVLWQMPHVSVRGTLGGISLPPVLLPRIPGIQGERLLLYHYTNDTLCHTLKALACKFCIVSNDAAELRGHFGSAEHSYGHWLDLDLPKVSTPCGSC